MTRLALLLCLLLLVGCIPSVYDTPYPVSPVVLPQDDAAHPAPIEWWYYTGHLSDAVGNDYGFELALFKTYAPPTIRLGFIPAYWLFEKAHVGHFAVTDKTNRVFQMGERADFWGYQADASAQDLEVFVGGWRAERAEDGVSHRITASTDDYRIDLTLTPLKPAALHGDPPSIQSMGPGGVSYYVSYTRMAVTGTLGRNCSFTGCETVMVTGQAWHDHQWGDFDLSSYAGWDWFSLQFHDNTELMLYLIRQPSSAYSDAAGSFITEDGRTLNLSAEDFEIVETGETWTSPETGAIYIYPLGWRVQVPRHGIDVTVTPVMQEQEMDTRATTGIVYWEGAVEVTGSRSGVGYVELTNYDLYPYGMTDENTPLQPMRGPLGLSNP